jgi:hypothetical protein
VRRPFDAFQFISNASEALKWLVGSVEKRGGRVIINDRKTLYDPHSSRDVSRRVGAAYTADYATLTKAFDSIRFRPVGKGR